LPKKSTIAEALSKDKEGKESIKLVELNTKIGGIEEKLNLLVGLTNALKSKINDAPKNPQ